MNGDRFGSYGFGAGLTGLLLALTPVGAVLAAALLVAGVVLGLTGCVRYAHGAAPPRDAAGGGRGTGAPGLVVLFVEAAVALTLPVSPYYWMP